MKKKFDNLCVFLRKEKEKSFKVGLPIKSSFKYTVIFVFVIFKNQNYLFRAKIIRT